MDKQLRTIPSKILLMSLIAPFLLGTCLCYGKDSADQLAYAQSIFTAQKFERQGDSLNLFVEVDAGAFLFRNRSDWDPDFAIRLGVGTKLAWLYTYLFLDYYHFNLESAKYHLYSYTSQNAKREDLAIYCAAVFCGYVEVGIGTFYTGSSKVNYRYPGDPTELPWVDSGRNEFRLFYMFGARYDVGLGGGTHMPLGLYYRNTDYGTRDLFPVLLRIGLLKEF